jgi:hypothetical protein
MSPLQSILAKYRSQSQSEREKGSSILRTSKEAVTDLDHAIFQHGFRISIALYQQLRSELER